MKDLKAFTAYLLRSKFGKLLDESYGAGKAETDAPRLFEIYQKYQQGELNLQEMAKEMGYDTIGLSADGLKKWLPSLVPRNLPCRVQVVEITPRTKGFEDELEQHKARGGQVRDIKGGELYT